jgi:hypothetical protein
MMAGRDIRCVDGLIRAKSGNQIPNLSPSDAFLRSLALEQQEDLSSVPNRTGKLVEVKGKCEVSFHKNWPEPTRLFLGSLRSVKRWLRRCSGEATVGKMGLIPRISSQGTQRKELSHGDLHHDNQVH